MEAQVIVEEIKKVILKLTSADPVTIEWDLDGPIHTLYALDSFLLVEVLLAMEEGLDITIDVEHMGVADIYSIHSLANFLAKIVNES